MKTLWVFVLLYTLSVNLSFIASDSASDTLKFVHELESKLNLTDNQPITLVVGNTGSGKSTLVHYAAGNMSKLSAVLKDGSVDLTIRDEYDPENGDTTSAAVSRTLLPEMMIDEEKNVWFDCPGYGDTRNNTIEIATAFLIKRVIKSASHLKLVLLASYFSVANDGSRDDFAHLITRTLQLVKNVTQFENSVSLVVTKAPPFFAWDPTKEIVEKDIQQVTAKFINGYRSLLQQQASNEQKIQFVDILLKQSENQEYPKIAVFWRPNKLGRFDQIEKMANGRQKIRDTIIKQSAYAPIKQNDEFGFPLTAEAQIEVGHLMTIVSDNIRNELNHVVDQLKKEFLEKMRSIYFSKNKLKLIDLGNNSIDLTNITASMSMNQLTLQLTKLNQALNLRELNFTECEKNQKNFEIFESLIDSSGVIVPKISYAEFLNEIIEFFSVQYAEVNSQIQKTELMICFGFILFIVLWKVFVK